MDHDVLELLAAANEQLLEHNVSLRVVTAVSGPPQAAIVLREHATINDAKLAASWAVRLQELLNRAHWLDGGLVADLAAMRAREEWSWTSAARFANALILQELLALVSLESDFPDSHAATFEARAGLFDSAMRQLVALKGKKRREECRQILADALALLRAGQAPWPDLYPIDVQRLRDAVRAYEEQGSK